MLQINNISITDAASKIMREHRSRFKPRNPGEVFGLIYMSSFVNADGTPVSGFRPGYTPDSVSPRARGDIWALAKPAAGLEFLFMPKFKWSADAQYVVDVASETFETLSIERAATR